jgi:hypothetical protein
MARCIPVLVQISRHVRSASRATCRVARSVQSAAATPLKGTKKVNVTRTIRLVAAAKGKASVAGRHGRVHELGIARARHRRAAIRPRHLARLPRRPYIRPIPARDRPEEIITAVRTRRAPMMSVSAGLKL